MNSLLNALFPPTSDVPTLEPILNNTISFINDTGLVSQPTITVALSWVHALPQLLSIVLYLSYKWSKTKAPSDPAASHAAKSEESVSERKDGLRSIPLLPATRAVTPSTFLPGGNEYRGGDAKALFARTRSPLGSTAPTSPDRQCVRPYRPVTVPIYISFGRQCRRGQPHLQSSDSSGNASASPNPSSTGDSGGTSGTVSHEIILSPEQPLALGPTRANRVRTSSTGTVFPDPPVVSVPSLPDLPGPAPLGLPPSSLPDRSRRGYSDDPAMHVAAAARTQYDRAHSAAHSPANSAASRARTASTGPPSPPSGVLSRAASSIADLSGKH